MPTPKSTRPNLNFFGPQPALFNNENSCCSKECLEVLKCIDSEFYHDANVTLNPLPVFGNVLTIVPVLQYQVIKSGTFLIQFEADWHVRTIATFIGYATGQVRILINGIADANSLRSIVQTWDAPITPFNTFPVVKFMVNRAITLIAGDLIQIQVNSNITGILPLPPAGQSHLLGKSLTIERKLLTI